MRKLLIAAAALGTLYLLAGCAPGCDAYYRDLTFRGNAPTDITGTGADDAAVVTALNALLTNRIYDPNTYMQYGSCGKSNKSRIQNGAVSSFIQGHEIDYEHPEAGIANGTGNGAGVYYTMEFTLPEGPHLSVRFIYNVGQGMLSEIGAQQAADESTLTDVADCSLSGNLAGKPVDLDFKQELHGVADVNGGPGW